MSSNPHFVRADVGQQNVVRSHNLTRVPQCFLRFDGAFRCVVFIFGKIFAHAGTNFFLQRKVIVRQAVFVDAFVEHPECVREITDEFDFRVIMFIDLGRQKVGMQDGLFFAFVPQHRVILNHVETERDDKISIINGA